MKICKYKLIEKLNQTKTEKLWHTIWIKQEENYKNVYTNIVESNKINILQCKNFENENCFGDLWQHQHLPSMSSQWPVITQMQTMDTERQKAIISAPVNLPHIPNDILWTTNISFLKS